MLEQQRIIFLFGSFDLGGAERQGLLLADYLKTRFKARVKVLALNTRPGMLSECCDNMGIAWQGIPFHWGLSRRWFYFPRALATLKAERPDILISYTCVPNIVCALCRRASGAKLSVWNQADEGLLMNRWPLHRWAVRHSGCVISNSSGGKEFLAGAYGIPGRDIHLIYNGVSLPKPVKDRASWRRELGLEPDDLVACMVANLSAHKDHATLIRAWRQAVAAPPGGHRPVLLLAGRFDGAEQRIRELMSELQLTDCVKLLGPVADIPGLLDAADLFLYSSKSEGIPNAVLEAMSTGLPVAGSDIPGIREAVGAGGEPFLAPVGDHEGLARQIKRLISDRELRQSHGASLRRRVETEFNLERMGESSALVIANALSKTLLSKNHGR